MNLFTKIWCRLYQTVFRLAIPFMPYRIPRRLSGCEEAATLISFRGGRRALLVTDKGVRGCGLLAPITAALEKHGVGYEIYDGTPVNPTVSAIEEAVSLYRERCCDTLIAVGGGSPMDCAKGVCARLMRPKKTLLQMKGLLKVHGRRPLFIAVPTTAGTGSETTVAAVVTDDKTHYKFTILSFCLAPRYALLDPQMTRTLPPRQTAETGLDALTHAVEAYIGRSTTRLTRRCAVNAVRLIRDNLLPAYENGDNMEARRNMQNAAFDAGLAFTISYVGYVHAIAHSLGGAYNYPHGRTNATLLPYILEKYGKKAQRRLKKLAHLTGISTAKRKEEAAREFIAWIRTLNERTGIPARIPMREQDIPTMAANADREANPLYPVPRLMGKSELEELYRGIRSYPALGSEEKLALQREYFATGQTLPVARRRRLLKKLYSAIRAHEDEINEALKRDLGKSAAESYMCEVGMTLAEITHMQKHMKQYANAKRVRTPLAQFCAKSYVLPSPYGCVLIMSPWNYPFLLTMEPLVDALAAGNCAIVKPSAYSPATGEVMKKLIEEVFPPEIAAVVLGGRAENSALLDLPFDKIFFTGSVAVGKEVMRHASERLIPVTLELGGKSPCIVDRTADLRLAAKRIVFGKFLNCGQTCVAPDYILVHRDVEEAFFEELKKQLERQYGARPLDDPDYGKIISEKHFKRLCGLIDGEKVAIGGEREEGTLRISPTVMRGVTREDAVMQEEIFGPILPILTYTDEEELIREINENGSPLALYLFTKKKETVKKFLSRVSFGGGCVNDVVIHLATSNMGFGGVGKSGMGSYHGRDGFECFTHKKSIVDKKTWIDLPMRYRPYKKFYEKLVRKFLK